MPTRPYRAGRPSERTASHLGAGNDTRAMRAVVMREFGPPSVLVAEEVPDPAPGPDQVVIDVEVANITSSKPRCAQAVHPTSRCFHHYRRSWATALVAWSPGSASGLTSIDRPAGDCESARYRRLRANCGGRGRGMIDVPDALSTSEAVALLADGRTALMLVRAADVRAGETVALEAAAGGVGSLLVQLAARAGARVVGAAGGRPQAADCARAGRHHGGRLHPIRMDGLGRISGGQRRRCL